MLYARFSRRQTDGLFLSALALFTLALLWLVSFRPLDSVERQPEVIAVNPEPAPAPQVSDFDWKKALQPGLSPEELYLKYGAVFSDEKPSVVADTAGALIASVDTSLANTRDSLVASAADTAEVLIASVDSVDSQIEDELISEIVKIYADSVLMEVSDKDSVWAEEYNAAKDETPWLLNEVLPPVGVLLCCLALFALLVSGADWILSLVLPNCEGYPATPGLVPDAQLSEVQKQSVFRAKSILYLGYVLPAQIFLGLPGAQAAYCLHSLLLALRVFGRSTAEIHYAWDRSGFVRNGWSSSTLAVLFFTLACSKYVEVPYYELWNALSGYLAIFQWFWLFYIVFQKTQNKSEPSISGLPLTDKEPLSREVRSSQAAGEGQLFHFGQNQREGTNDPDEAALELDLSRQDLVAVPRRVSNFRYLLRLNLSHNGLTKIEEQDLRKCTALTELDVSYNRLTELPDFLFSMPALRRIVVVGNPIPAQDLASYQSAYPYVTLVVSKNKQREIDKILGKDNKG